MFGFLGIVWPVRDTGDRRLVLKVHSPAPRHRRRARVALEAARGPALVELVRADPTANALLLERLDPKQTLDDVDVDEACGVIGDLVAHISSHDAPPGAGNGRRARPHARLDPGPADDLRGAVPRPFVDRALDALAGLAADLQASVGPLPLVHADCHYVNVLHTLPGEPPRWVAIGPLPMAGYPELEVIAAVRNRWSDAAATGDAEAALRRRCDIICERAELDWDLAGVLLQTVAVDNFLWHLAGHRRQHQLGRSAALLNRGALDLTYPSPGETTFSPATRKVANTCNLERLGSRLVCRRRGTRGARSRPGGVRGVRGCSGPPNSAVPASHVRRLASRGGRHPGGPHASIHRVAAARTRQRAASSTPGWPSSARSSTRERNRGDESEPWTTC